MYPVPYKPSHKPMLKTFPCTRHSFAGSEAVILYTGLLIEHKIKFKINSEQSLATKTSRLINPIYTFQAIGEVGTRRGNPHPAIQKQHLCQLY